MKKLSLSSTAMVIGTLVCLWGTSCSKTSSSAAPSPTAKQPLLSQLEDNYSFGLFYYAVKKTGLDKILSGPGSYTVLLPDNDAFARDSILDDSDLDKLDTAYLRQWISYHILPGTITSASVAQTLNNPYPCITGQSLYFSRPVPEQGETVPTTVMHINGDTINDVDLLAGNGVIQVMNRPLKLPVSSVQAYLASQPRYSYFVAGLKNFGLWDELTGTGPFTIWAPDNASFTHLGIDADSLNKIDTVHFSASFMGIYVLTPARVFLTDFIDAPGTTFLFFPNNGPYYYVNYGPPGSLGNLGDHIGFNDDLPTTWTDPDVIAGNGVVQGIDGLLLLPSQTTK